MKKNLYLERYRRRAEIKPYRLKTVLQKPIFPIRFETSKGPHLHPRNFAWTLSKARGQPWMGDGRRRWCCYFEKENHFVRIRICLRDADRKVPSGNCCRNRKKSATTTCPRRSQWRSGVSVAFGPLSRVYTVLPKKVAGNFATEEGRRSDWGEWVKRQNQGTSSISQVIMVRLGLNHLSQPSPALGSYGRCKLWLEAQISRYLKNFEN